MNQDSIILMSLKAASPKAVYLKKSWEDYLNNQNTISQGHRFSRSVDNLSSSDEWIVGLGIALLGMFMLSVVVAFAYGVRQRNFRAQATRGYLPL